MADYFYKSNEPAAVAVVNEFYTQKNVLMDGMVILARLFGGEVAGMRSASTHYAGGVKLSTSSDLDAHWRRPDKFGYRSLRSSAKPIKGISKEDRAAINTEHERLLALWKNNCPVHLPVLKYWTQLGINSGNIILNGGVKFALDGTAYFHLGFQINEADHLANVAAEKPTAGWINGAVEILSSEYEAAREARNAQTAKP